MSSLDDKRVKCYFLFNFEQIKDFTEKYALYEGAWYRQVLYYTTIFGIPDAVVWNTETYIRDEIVERYSLTLVKKNGSEEYWKY